MKDNLLILYIHKILSTQNQMNISLLFKLRYSSLNFSIIH